MLFLVNNENGWYQETPAGYCSGEVSNEHLSQVQNVHELFRHEHSRCFGFAMLHQIKGKTHTLASFYLKFFWKRIGWRISVPVWSAMFIAQKTAFFRNSNIEPYSFPLLGEQGNKKVKRWKLFLLQLIYRGYLKTNQVISNSVFKMKSVQRTLATSWDKRAP